MNAHHALRQTHQIRVIEIEGSPWFVGTDVIHILYGKTIGQGHLYGKLGADEMCKVKRVHLGMTPGKPMVLVSESGLYKMIMRSDKPEARQFQEWVTRHVLPAIRKDGGYILGEEKVARQFPLIQIFERLPRPLTCPLPLSVFFH